MILIYSLPLSVCGPAINDSSLFDEDWMQTDRVSVYAQGNDLDQRQSMELIYPAFIDITIEIM
ncbi:MAG: hypothetical protein HKN43_05400, partial [Rhodothermales bacterium]|nr:hypothetical protein [Rhodothermales bacterium]